MGTLTSLTKILVGILYLAKVLFGVNDQSKHDIFLTELYPDYLFPQKKEFDGLWGRCQ